jgi:hypothetical protein
MEVDHHIVVTDMEIIQGADEVCRIPHVMWRVAIMGS